MTSHARSRPTGRNLIAQGEPLVWLTGGMFAIACAMIVSLLGLILYQGLSTLWPRSYVVFALDDGSLASGEWIASQPYRLTAESIAEFPEKTQAKARKLLQNRSSVPSEQIYLRTGNYDVGNRHFAYVPVVSVDSQEPQRPEGIWLVERLESGFLYGFPTEFTSDFSPEMDRDFSIQKALLDQIDRFRPAEESKGAAFDQAIEKLRMRMESESKSLEESYRSKGSGSPARVQKIDEISNAVAVSHRKMLNVQRDLEHAKHELGRSDQSVARLRLAVRKAELAENTDLLSRLDEGIELATALGTIDQQWKDIHEGLQLCRNSLADAPALSPVLDEIQKTANEQEEQEVAPVKESLAAWLNDFTASLPARSRQSVEKALEEARAVASKQFEINTEIGRLEWIRGSEQVLFALPILEGSPGDSAEWSGEVKTGIVSKQDADGKPVYFWRAKQDVAPIPLQTKSVATADIVRWFEPNRLSLFGKLGVYASRWIEFVAGVPREAGVEGGFFPAIWGTVVMTLLMSLAVMPFGVMAALYMREYARPGWVLSLIRISINNLAGVPSIVYGVFGLAFFCYTIGGYIDGGPKKAGFDPWPSSTWFAACAATVVAGTIAFFFAFLGSGSPAHMTKLRKRIASFAGVFWVLSLVGFVALIVKVPFFDGFYQASLPNPTFGKGCLLWASCTLALLTLPVVIVATEEALAAVPNSLREGSYACGAGKWQTLQRIVLPYARPGIITGFILSMARGAGEVAPMMLVGAIPLATELPLDLEFPFFHGSRSFMHLGFQIFSLGFQSQNSEAAKPMVFTATLLLLTIVTFLNIAAIWLRAQLRKRFQSSQF